MRNYIHIYKYIPELRSDEDEEIVKSEMDDAEFGEQPKCTSLITSSSIATFSVEQKPVWLHVRIHISLYVYVVYVCKYIIIYMYMIYHISIHMYMYIHTQIIVDRYSKDLGHRFH